MLHCNVCAIEKRKKKLQKKFYDLEKSLVTFISQPKSLTRMEDFVVQLELEYWGDGVF